MRIISCVFTVILCLVFPTVLLAGNLTGVVQRVVAPYILLKTDSGFDTVKLRNGASLGNLDSIGHIKGGGESVDVEWMGEHNHVKQATSFSRLPSFTAYPALEVPAEQAATWHNLESGPDKHVMVDVRSREEWEEGHIVRSLSVPFNHAEAQYSPYSADKNHGVVLYGSSTQNNLVHRAAQGALTAGYRKIRTYSGGAADWTKRGKPLGIAVAGAKRRIERNEPLLIVDVRGEDEWRKGHIPGSISSSQFGFTPEVVSVRERNYPLPVLLVGHSVQEAGAVFNIREWGRSHNAPVFLLEGGFDAWKEAGYPVTQGGSSPTAADYVPDGEIGFAEFKELWHSTNSESASLLVNLRDSGETTVSEKLNIPFFELEDRMTELPKNKEIVLFCYTGTRALIALHMLKNNGYKVRYLNRTVRLGKNGELIE